MNRPDGAALRASGLRCGIGALALALVAAATPFGGRAAAAPAVKGTRAIPVHATFDVWESERNTTELARGAVHGVRRIEGGTVLYYSLGFLERYGLDVNFLFTHRQIATGDRWNIDGFWATPQLVDAAGRHAYSTLVASENGPCLCSPLAATENKAGKLFVLYNVFPPLPPGVRSVNVVLGYRTVANAVPVEDGAMLPAADPSRPILLGSGWPRIDPAAVAAAPDKDRSITDLETRLRDFANQITTVEAPRRVSIEVSADVLFAVDSAALTPQAQASLAKVARTVNDRAGAGTVSVVGHTDDTGPDTRNDPLSEQRAAAVRAALEPLVTVPGLTYEVAGRGEREPVAASTTEAGRQANRRVTVTFAPKA